jgi:hypothetical protein
MVVLLAVGRFAYGVHLPTRTPPASRSPYAALIRSRCKSTLLKRRGILPRGPRSGGSVVSDDARPGVRSNFGLAWHPHTERITHAQLGNALAFYGREGCERFESACAFELGGARTAGVTTRWYGGFPPGVDAEVLISTRSRALACRGSAVAMVVSLLPNPLVRGRKRVSWCDSVISF